MKGELFLQMNMIVISNLIEAFPFILIGVLISGIIQIFVTEEMMARVIPKNKLLAFFLASVIGAILLERSGTNIPLLLIYTNKQKYYF